MKTLYFALFMFVVFFAQAQTDSLEIKLQQYKNLFEKGLITGAEYEKLRARELKLGTSASANTGGAPVKKARGENVNIIVGPVVYYDLAYKMVDKYVAGTFSNVYYKNHGFGLNVQVGGNIKRRFFPNLSMGLEGSKKRIAVPIGAHFTMNITRGRVAPYFHSGFGYMYHRYQYASYVKQFNGLYLLAGFGLNIKLAKNVNLLIAPDYRFVYQAEPLERSVTSNPESGISYTRHHLIHQIGGRIQILFM